MKRVNLLTGRPGSGKTTIIKRLAAGWGAAAGGFYTEEIRSGGARQGFRLITLDGESAVLAHTTIKSRYRVGKYGVDIAALEGIGLAALVRAAGDGKLVVIDEIGKMELCSEVFRKMVTGIIDDGRSRVLGTIMSSPHPVTDAIKRLDQVSLIEVTAANRDRVFRELTTLLITPGEVGHR